MGDGQRILLCTDYLPPSDGGVEQVVQELAERLTDRGYEVGVYTLAEPDEDIDLRGRLDVDVYTSRKFDLTETIGLQSAVSPGALVEFGRVLDAHDPDIVHVHNRFFFSTYVALGYAHLADRPLVTTMHLGDIDHIDGVAGSAARALQSVFARLLLQRSDAVICVSDAVAEVADGLGATDPTVVRNAVDIDAFTVAETEFEKRLLYVGRLVRNNGPQDLIEAVPAILDAHPGATVDVVGSGTLRSDLEARADTLGVSESVTFHGFVDDIHAMYERASVFCRPSYSEGLPLTLLESMATYNVPVVTPVAGTQEVITDGETGRFVDPGDPSSIAAAVGDLFENPAAATRMTQAAQTLVEENFTWDERTANVIEVYDAVTRDGATGRMADGDVARSGDRR
jgi:glycosyltransferase involved in cell wall biosynthesis